MLNEGQMISMGIFLFIAGEETAAISISTGLYHFTRHPGIYQLLRRDPSLLHTTALEEFFRFDGPVHLLGRIAKEDVTINNVTIPIESPITLVLASANRDEQQFTNADTMNIYRTPNQHLAFGHGTHFCMGEWLGKMQTRIAFERFIAKFESLDINLQDISWIKNIAVKGMTSLNVTAK